PCAEREAGSEQNESSQHELDSPTGIGSQARLCEIAFEGLALAASPRLRYAESVRARPEMGARPITSSRSPTLRPQGGGGTEFSDLSLNFCDCRNPLGCPAITERGEVT